MALVVAVVALTFSLGVFGPAVGAASSAPPACAGTPFSVSTQAELVAAVNCYNTAPSAEAGAYSIEILNDITYTTATEPRINRTGRGWELTIYGQGNTLDAAGLVAPVLGNTLGTTTIDLIGLTGGIGGPFSIGGGLQVAGGSVLLTDSSVFGNTATSGGGIGISGGFLLMAQSTVSGNSATAAVGEGGGGGVYAEPASRALSVTRSTVTDNAANVGSGIASRGVVGADTFMVGSVIADNHALGNDPVNDLELVFSSSPPFDSFNSFGANVLGPIGPDISVFVGSDVLLGPMVPSALLGPLATGLRGLPVHTPNFNSPAVDIDALAPDFDAQGVARPIGMGSDSGAIEMDPMALLCAGYAVTVDLGAGDVPTTGHDVILGTNGMDVIVASTGDDIICGLAGDDTINAGPGDDLVDAGEGADTVFGLSGDDEINAGPGDDRVIGDIGDDLIRGGLDNDTINGGPGNDSLFGNEGDDEAFGLGGDDHLDGGSGADKLLGGDDTDTLFGDDGDDVINGGAGDDQAYGGADNDVVFGLTGNDQLLGDAGDDRVFGQIGNDFVDGGAGNDQLFGNEGDDAITVPSGTNIINGGPGNDTLDGGTGPDTIYGDGNLAQAGNDQIFGGAGPDQLFGFAGEDSITADDGEADLINGGPDNDTCAVDLVDTTFNCP